MSSIKHEAGDRYALTWVKEVPVSNGIWKLKPTHGATHFSLYNLYHDVYLGATYTFMELGIKEWTHGKTHMALSTSYTEPWKINCE
jgi:hypothetical protein